MGEMRDLLKKSGYSDKAADYYLNKVNVGELSDPDAYAIYTGPCGDTMEFFLKIEDGTIKDASFQAIGCAGAFSSGSALSDMVRGKTVEEAEKLEEEDIVKFLDKIPLQKIHCACLAKRTMRKAIAAYEGKPFIV
jgi:NifU-like protein involved in Fe-S cluster formation